MSELIRSCSWLLTIKCADVSFDELKEKLKNYVYVGQKEKGEQTGYEHYQIYIENPTQIRFETLKNKFPSGHFEIRRGTKRQAYEYCTKEDTRVGEVFGNGEIDIEDEQGKRKDIEILYNMIMLENKTPSQVILEYPCAGRYLNYIDRLYNEKLFAIYRSKLRLELKENTYYIWGDPNTNKTRYPYDKHGYENVYRVTDYKHPFDEYQGESVLVLDEFHSQLKIEQMLNLLDIYPYKLPCRYVNKIACYTTVYIISNLPLEEQYTDIQSKHPKQFEALKRRISDIVCFNKVQTSVFDSDKPFIGS